MKTILAFASLLGFACSAGAFDVPRKAWFMKDLAEARAAAVEKGRGIMILYTDPKLEPS